MSKFRVYSVSLSDVFDPGNYPEITGELEELSKRIRLFPATGKVHAAISFLKDHCINSVWANANPVLVSAFRSGKVDRVEYMFESCRHNTVFLRDFEKYVSAELHK